VSSRAAEFYIEDSSFIYEESAIGIFLYKPAPLNTTSSRVEGWFSGMPAGSLAELVDQRTVVVQPVHVCHQAGFIVSPLYIVYPAAYVVSN
jgi:hypothetical protein